LASSWGDGLRWFAAGGGAVRRYGDDEFGSSGRKWVVWYVRPFPFLCLKR